MLSRQMAWLFGNLGAYSTPSHWGLPFSVRISLLSPWHKAAFNACAYWPLPAARVWNLCAYSAAQHFPRNTLDCCSDLPFLSYSVQTRVRKVQEIIWRRSAPCHRISRPWLPPASLSASGRETTGFHWYIHGEQWNILSGKQAGSRCKCLYLIRKADKIQNVVQRAE